jgi:hypothetical protein
MVTTQAYGTGNNLIAGRIISDVLALQADTYYTGMRLESEAAGVSVADAGNTGDGTVTAITANKDAPSGAYLLTCIEETEGDALAIAPAVAAPGNTGNGVVDNEALIAGGGPAIPGDYIIECLDGAAQDTLAVGASVPGIGNTGTGIIDNEAISAVGAPAIVGDYLIECIDGDPGGTPASVLGAVPNPGNTGNGTIAAPTYGAATIPGTYRLVCVDATVPTAEIDVFDPNGVELGQATVGVAYANNHLAFTIVVGLANFVIGDVWTILVYMADGGIFRVTDPRGVLLTDTLQLPGTPAGTVTYNNNGITFRINDAGTDFVAGDNFTIPVIGEHGGRFSVTDPRGRVLSANILLPGTPAGNVAFIGAGITFFINDGVVDFITGDNFTLTVTGSHGGRFQLTSPTGQILDDNLVMPGTPGGTLAYIGACGVKFTITDGAADFVTGDFFTITISSALTYKAITTTGKISAIYNGTNARVLGAPGYDNCIVGGEVYIEGLRTDTDGVVTLTAKQLVDYQAAGFYVKSK